MENFINSYFWPHNQRAKRFLHAKKLKTYSKCIKQTEITQQLKKSCFDCALGSEFAFHFYCSNVKLRPELIPMWCFHNSSDWTCCKTLMHKLRLRRQISIKTFLNIKVILKSFQFFILFNKNFINRIKVLQNQQSLIFYLFDLWSELIAIL